MNRQEYQRYLQSDEWRRKAFQRMKLDGYQCQMCGNHGTSMVPLETHHLNYKHIGNEDLMTDLVTVCRSCHRAIHKLMNRVTAYNPDGSVRHGWKDDIPLSTHVFNINGQNEIVMD